MEETIHQLSFDDIEQAQIISSEPGRTAFIDECGNFGFDFVKEGTSRYFLICAIIVNNSDIHNLEISIEHIRNKKFGNGEMKSSSIGDNDRRRLAVITDLLQLNFKIIYLLADKKLFYDDSPLKDYKISFIKYLHNRLYNNLYTVYHKLNIIADQIGTSEFQTGFKEYVSKNRPQYNFFDEYDFDFIDSTSSNITQLSDMIAGSLYKGHTGQSQIKFQDILRGKIFYCEHFPIKHPKGTIVSDDDKRFDSSIYDLAITQAETYMNKYKDDENIDKRLQIAFLKYLLFQVRNIDAFKFISSIQLKTVLSEYADRSVTRDYLYRQIIPPLRDAGIIISSCQHGYKIPVSLEDIYLYLNQTDTVIGPMLHRINICRRLIRQKTDDTLDIFNQDKYIKYKKFFD